MSGPRIADKIRKAIIADRAYGESIRGIAKRYKVSTTSVQRILKENPEMAQLVTQKKEQNTADILDYMEGQRDDVCKVLGICLSELKKAERYEKTPPQQIATTMAILIDKYTAFGGGPKDETEEDSLSRSLRELGEGLESDD